jgi:hypothetical protein
VPAASSKPAAARNRRGEVLREGSQGKEPMPDDLSARGRSGLGLSSDDTVPLRSSQGSIVASGDSLAKRSERLYSGSWVLSVFPFANYGCTMPSRPLSLAILAFWLATMGWMFYRDFLPQFQPSDTTTLAELIDLPAESRTGRIRWAIYKGPDRVGAAQSEVKYRKLGDTYELRTDFRFTRFEILGVTVDNLTSIQRVTPTGALREDRGRAFLRVAGFSFEVTAGGRVEEGVLTPYVKIKPKPLDVLSPRPKPLQVSDEESVLNPMHPFDRFYNLHEGKHWRQRLANQLVNTVDRSLLDPSAWTGFCEAEVQAHDFTWNNSRVACWAIIYRKDDKEIARTWVRQSDGRILQQEVDFLETRLTLQRQD